MTPRPMVAVTTSMTLSVLPAQLTLLDTVKWTCNQDNSSNDVAKIKHKSSASAVALVTMSLFTRTRVLTHS